MGHSRYLHNHWILAAASALLVLSLATRDAHAFGPKKSEKTGYKVVSSASIYRASARASNRGYDGGDEASDDEMLKDAINTISTHSRGVKLFSSPCSPSRATGEKPNVVQRVWRSITGGGASSTGVGGIITRQQWGASPPTGALAKMSHAPTKIILHETQGGPGETIKEIQEYHQHGRAKDGKKNFSDIGYHFLIGRNGEIYEGRPINTIGAHMPGANDALGIAIMSDSRGKTGRPPTEAQKAALVKLVHRLKQKVPTLTSMDTHGNAQHDPSHCTDCAKLLTPVAKRLSAELKNGRVIADDVAPIQGRT